MTAPRWRPGRRALRDALAGRRGVRALFAALLAVLLAVALGGWDRGFAATVVTMTPGSVWLVSADRGELTLLDTTTPAVVRHLPMANPGDPLAVGRGPTAYGLNGATGALSRIDGRTFAATTAPGVMTPSSTSPMLLTTDSSLYVLDIANRVARQVDTGTFTPRDAVALPTRPPDGGVDVDDTGRVWLTDTGTRDVAWLADGGGRLLHDAAPAPGAVIATTSEGPVLVSGQTGTVQQLGDSGAVRRTAHLPVGGDRIAVTGEGADVVDVVIGPSGVLVQCALEEETCTKPVTLGSGADLLGRPVAQDGLVFVPDHAGGRVFVVDPRRGAVVADPVAVHRGGAFELFAHDGAVVFNDPSGPDAGVVDADGTVHLVDKHARTAADPAPNPDPPPPSPPPTSPRPAARRAPTPARTPTAVPSSSAVDRQAAVPVTTTAAAPSTPVSTSGTPTTRRSATTTSTTPTTATTATTTAPTTTTAPEDATCDRLGGGVLADVDVTSDGRRSGLTFCPVLINDGDRPITGQFPVTGQVLGLEDGPPIMIVDKGNKDTCDALGGPPVDGTFAQNTTFDPATGRWSFFEDLGYPESVTIARHFEFVTGSEESLEFMREHHTNWSAAHPDQQQSYPGMDGLPDGVTVLATFDTPAGEFPGAQPCTGG